MTAYTWTPIIVVHATCAAAALVLGATVLARRKGTSSHRAFGWLWVMLMATVATVSFWIYRERWSWIHGLSIWTLIALTYGVHQARHHRLKSHRATMISLFVGALLITGLFTLLPGRLIGQALFGG